MDLTPESLYAKAALLTADFKIAASLDAMGQLSSGWPEKVSPTPVHKLLAEKLLVAEGRKHHETLYLQLLKVEPTGTKLTVNQARLWQFFSTRFFPKNLQGMMQFQLELSIILEELAREISKPLLQLVK